LILFFDNLVVAYFWATLHKFLLLFCYSVIYLFYLFYYIYFIYYREKGELTASHSLTRCEVHQSRRLARTATDGRIRSLWQNISGRRPLMVCVYGWRRDGRR